MITQKLPSIASSMLTISNTAITLQAAIRAADSPTSDNFEFISGANFVEVVIESKPIRYCIDGNTPSATQGILAYEGDTISLSPVDLDKFKMIRQTASDATVVVARIGRIKPGEI